MTTMNAIHVSQSFRKRFGNDAEENVNG